MNDEQDPELDPEQEARVRALLADLGTPPEAASMPPEVAARLDETLAGLVAERQVVSAKSPSNVVPLRRRWASRAAAAAAAVIVVGAGGVAVANLDVFSGSNGTSRQCRGRRRLGGQVRVPGLLDATLPASRAPAAGDLASRLPRITAASFDAYASRLVQTGRPPPLHRTAPRTGARPRGTAPLAEAAEGELPRPESRRPRRHQARAVRRQRSRARHPPSAWRPNSSSRPGPARAIGCWTAPASPVPLETSGQSSPGDPGLGSPTPTP